MWGALVGGVFLAAGMLLLGLAVAGLQRRNRILNGWVRLENARVIEARVDWVGLRAVPVVVYEYHSGDCHYLGEWRPWIPWPISGRQAERLAARFRPTDRIVVYVNPDDHRESTPFPAPPVWVSAWALAAGVTCFLLAASMWLRG